MSIDRKAQNGVGSRRIEMGSGNESTVVQNAKATSSFVSSLVDKYGGKSEDVARADVQAFADVNPNQAATGSKTLRSKSTFRARPATKGGPGGQSDQESFITDEAKRYKEGGEKITGSQMPSKKDPPKKEQPKLEVDKPNNSITPTIDSAHKDELARRRALENSERVEAIRRT